MTIGTDPKLNILLVDDHPENLLALESVLSDLDCNLVRAESGREALRQLLDVDFAVILLDVQMPDIDGFETARLIRTRDRSRHTPIIFLTAINKSDLHVTQGYSVGAVDYVFKPFQPEILRAKVITFVDLARKTRELELETEHRRKAEEEVRKLNSNLERRVAVRTAELETANKELGRVLSLEQTARAAAEEAQQRLKFLGEASAILSGSLDYETTLHQVASLAVPHIAGHCHVDLADDDRRLHRVAVVDAYPRGAGRRSRPVGTEDAAWAAAGARVMASARTELVPAAEGKQGKDGGARSMVVPLLARGDVVGTLTLSRDSSQPAYTPEDVVLAEDLARRAAAAIDNSRLFHEVEEAGRRKDEFLAMLAHELRNPLAAISSATYAMQRLEIPNRRLLRLCAIAGRQTHHLSRLVDDLLDISRITRGKIELRREVLALSTVVQRSVEAIGPLIEEKEHTLTVRQPEELIFVEADPTRLEQVLSNLLNNAAKYTEPGGRIELSVERGADPSARVVIKVKDNGVGIAPALLPTVFELFTQAESTLARSEGGLGIGLALVKRLVDLHGGEVGVHSEGVGAGSEFSVALPTVAEVPAHLRQDLPSMAVAEKPAPSRVAAAPRPASAGRERPTGLDVVVVDDNIDAAETMLEILESWGHQVRAAYTGPSALTMVESNPPHVVLLDIGLPGMDGFEVAKRLRAQPEFASLYLVALTGYGQAEDRRRSREAGFDLHLTKPVDPEQLHQVFRTLTERPWGDERDGDPAPDLVEAR